MASPLVSVIVPAFNAEAYVGEAVRSALNQDMPDLEVVVVDDGSTDCTKQIVSSIADDRLRVLSGPNRGVSEARNWAVDESRGEYLAFLDADDLWCPSKLRLQLDVFRSDVAAVGGRMRYISSTGKVLGQCGEDPTAIQERIRHATIMPFPMSSLCLRASVVKELRPAFDRDLSQAEDLDLLSRVAMKGEVAWVSEFVGFYRVHPSSASAVAYRRQREVQRFVSARAAARACASDPSAELPSRESGRRRSLNIARQDFSAGHFRAAGMCLLNRMAGRATIHFVAALALDPVRTLVRLRQRIT